jgi:hypothetical protein
MRAAGLQELEEMVKLLATALELPPGQDRYNALREIGRIRARLIALKGSFCQNGSADPIKYICQLFE